MVYPRLQLPSAQLGAFMVYLSQQQEASVHLFKRRDFSKLEPYLGMQRERNPEYLRDTSIRRVMFLHLVVTPGEYKRLVHELSDGTVEADTTIITFAIDLAPSTHWLVVLERRRTALRLPKTPQKMPNPQADKRKLEADLAAALAVEDYRAAAKLQHELKSNYGSNATKQEEKPKKRR